MINIRTHTIFLLMKNRLNNFPRKTLFFKPNVNLKLLVPCSIFFIFLQTSLSFAGDYHNQNDRRETQSGVTLACAQCHMMHGTQGGDSYSLIFSPGSANLYPKLIRAKDVVTLCKYCHQGDPYGIGAPIIFGPTYNASGGDFMIGSGSFNPSGSTGCNASDPFASNTMTYEGEKRHDIGCDVTNIPPPGFALVDLNGNTLNTSYNSANIKSLSFWQTSVITRHGNADGILSCEYCHDQHGNTNYRNVRPTPYDPNDRVPGGTGEDGTYKAQVTYNNGTWDSSSSIAQATIDLDAGGSPPTGQFSTNNITFRSSTNQIAGFCGKCHINFFGAPADANLGATASGDTNTGSSQWRRHPVGGISIGAGNGHTDPTNVASIALNARVRMINPDGAVGGADEQPFCFTCHRVHGSTNHSNLIFGSPKTTESNTSIGGVGTMLRDTCQQCHNQ